MTEPGNNLITAMRGLEVLKNKIGKLGVQYIQESRPQNRIMLEIETSAKQRIHLRVKSMTSGGWQASINDGDINPPIDESKFWVFIDLGQLTGHEIFYFVPEHVVKKRIETKHQEYLDKNGGERAISPDSKHHAIKIDRVVEWKSRWDLLGL